MKNKNLSDKQKKKLRLFSLWVIFFNGFNFLRFHQGYIKTAFFISVQISQFHNDIQPKYYQTLWNWFIRKSIIDKEKY